MKLWKGIREKLLILVLILVDISAFAQTEPNPILPDTLFLALGNSLELYNDDVAFVQLGSNPYTFEWECEVGNTDSGKWYWTGDQLGIFNLKFKCYLDGTLVDEESSIIKVEKKVSGEDFILLTIGNSLTAGGFEFQYQQISSDLDFTLNPTGTQGTTVMHEGHSGWEFKTFLGTESPFYFDGSIDPARYISSNGLQAPDIVRISLGINDCFLAESMDYITQNADILINAFLDAFPEAKVFIAMPTLCENSGTGWLLSYGTLDNYEPYQLRIREYWEYLLGAYGSSKGPGRVHVSYDGLCIDRNYGYPQDGNGGHTNGVHPNPTGYHQLSRGFSNVLNSFAHELSRPVDTEVPTVPSGLVITGTSESSISIIWNPSSDNVRVAGYKIFMDGAHYDTTVSTNYTIFGLQMGTSYSFSVSAFDDASNESERSSLVVGETATSPDTTPPSIPTGLQIVGTSESSLSLSWNPSSDNVNVAGYNIYVDGNFHESSSSTNYFISGLEEGTVYSVSVSAFDDDANESERSPPIVGQTESSPDTTPPSIPNGLNATEITNNSILLSWNPSSDDTGVEGYGVFLNDTRIDETNHTSYTFTGLDQSSSYALSVSAFDETGNESTPSTNILVSTADSSGIHNPPLPVVSILQISQEKGLAISQSTMSSYAYTELENFGVMVRSANSTIDDAELIYSNPNERVLSNDGREMGNLQVFYNYSDYSGDLVSELAGTDNNSNLKIDPPENVEWLPGQGLKVSGNTILYNKDVGARVIESIQKTEEISVENWLKPSAINQTSPANILGISEDNTQRFFIQEQVPHDGFYEYGIQLSTNQTDNFGNPKISTDTGIWNTGLQHVLYTRNALGIENIYLNGELVKSSKRNGTYSSLTRQQQLDICNLHFMDAPWNGTLFLTAIYNRALKASEVLNNFIAGTGRVEYINEIIDLVPGQTYYIYPFAQTKQGMVIGDSISLIMDREDLAPREDTIIFEVYPNPSSGKFIVRIDENTQFHEPANLRIANFSGQVVYAQNISGSDTFFPNEIELDLSPQLTSGLYSIMLISGSRASAKKLLIQQ